MKKITITGMEVKTIYHISISPMNMEDIMEEVLRKDRSLLVTLGAFEGYNLDGLEPTRATCRQFLRELWSVGSTSAKTINFIVREILGFDGVENYGLYNAEDDAAQMVVFKRGDWVNL